MMEDLQTVDKVALDPNCFYGFFDETGDEKITPEQDFFAFSGFGFVGDFGVDEFTAEWLKLRQDIFKVPEKKEYHSKNYVPKFRKTGHKLLPVTALLTKFLIQFMSYCVLNTTFVDCDVTEKNIKVVEGLLRGLSEQTATLFQNRVKHDEWYFEHSHRLNPIMMACWPPEYAHSQQRGKLHFVRKRSMIAMVEAADFVSYLVHHHIKSIYSGRPSPFHAAFAELFGNPSRGAFGYIYGMFGPVRIPAHT